MQFPVPQFTDVEDRIIGSLTLKQFGIIFGGGAIVFGVFSASKSIPITILFGLLVGLPTLGLAFGKLNGRPLYNSFGFVIKFLTSPKVMVFHKESVFLGKSSTMRNAELVSASTVKIQPQAVNETKTRIKEINILLQKQAAEERELAGKIK